LYSPSTFDEENVASEVKRVVVEPFFLSGELVKLKFEEQDD
jgi:hypothetical protein